MVGFGRPHVERNECVSLVLSGLQVCQERHFSNESFNELGECVCSFFGCRHHHNLDVRVPVEKPQAQCSGNEGFAHPTESLNDCSLWAVLEEVGNVVLDRRGLRKVKVLPNEVQERPEVFLQDIRFH